MSRERIANSLGVEPSEIDRFMGPPGENYFTPEQKRYIERQISSGMHITDVAKNLGVDPDDVSIFLDSTSSEEPPDSPVDANTTNQNYNRPRSVYPETSQEKEAIAQDFLSGMSFPKLSAKYGYAMMAINIFLRKTYHNYDEMLATSMANRQDKRGRKLDISRADQDDMRQLFISGTSIGTIAKTYGVTYTYVHQLLNSRGEDEYKEMRLKHMDAAARNANTGTQATTNIYRPGSIGNNRSQGPGSKNIRGNLVDRYR
jgi:lambda repressor-like predicted transcriptional regulator